MGQPTADQSPGSTPVGSGRLDGLLFLILSRDKNLIIYLLYTECGSIKRHGHDFQCDDCRPHSKHQLFPT